MLYAVCSAEAWHWYRDRLLAGMPVCVGRHRIKLEIVISRWWIVQPEFQNSKGPAKSKH